MKCYLKILFAIPIIILLVSCGKKPAPPAPPPPGVVCALALKQDVSNTFEYIGQIVAEDWVDLVARVEGYLIKRNFEEGSLVKQNDLVFEIDPKPFEAKVKEAEGDLVRAEAALVLANIQVDRYTKLVKDDAVAQKELDEANKSQGAAKGDMLVAQGNLDLARINLGYTKITAPFDGKIGVCSISVGNLVGPTINTNLSKIVRMDPVKVEFSVPEPKIISILERGISIDKAGEDIQCRMTLSNGSDYPEEGVIYFSDNVVNTSTGTLLIRARFKNPRGILNPGEYVKVKLGRKTMEPSILVPAVAIQRDQTGEFVFIADKDSKVQRRTVKTGQAHGLNIVILEGLSEGERVITQGILKVRPGVIAAVTMEKDLNPSAPYKFEKTQQNPSPIQQKAPSGG